MSTFDSRPPKSRATKDPLRDVAFYFALIYVFIIFTQLHELLVIATGVNTRLLTIVAVPAFLLVLATGGFRRSLQKGAAKYWVGFTIWMVLALPFSLWKGESLFLTFTWIRAELIVLFVIAGCVRTWKEFKLLTGVLALAAAVDVIAGRVLADSLLGRLRLAGTGMADPNDYAALLILVLPFLLLVAMSSWQGIMTRMIAAIFLLYGLYLILMTQSRGALVAVVTAVLFCLWKLQLSRKIIAAMIVSVLVLGAVIVLPQPVLRRFATIFGNDNSVAEQSEMSGDAIGSKQARTYLLKQSILATFRHPLFGVGAGQFQVYENQMAQELGQRGQWHQTHNSFTQVSSEIGLPALFFFTAAMIATYRLLDGVYQRARHAPRNPASERIRTTAFCLLISQVGFCVSIFFLSLAYRFYLPALTGLAIAISRAAHQEWRRGNVPDAVAPSLVSDNIEATAVF